MPSESLRERVVYSLRRRPVRIAEAALGLLVALGILNSPESVEEVLLLLGQLATLLGLEVTQRRNTTTLFDPRTNDGRSLVPSDDPHASHHYGHRGLTT